MENKRIDINKYVLEKIRQYKPGPRPASGPRPYSKKKYQAALERALTPQTLAQIAGEVGTSHATMLQWSRQPRFRHTVDSEQEEFAVFFVDQVLEVYAENAQEFSEKFDAWLTTDDKSPSPDPRGVEFKNVAYMPKGLQMAIYKELINRVKRSEEDESNLENSVITTTALDNFEEILFPGENSSRRKEFRFELVRAYAECLRPVLEGAELTLRQRKDIQVLHDLLLRTGTLKYLKES